MFIGAIPSRKSTRLIKEVKPRKYTHSKPDEEDDTSLEIIDSALDYVIMTEDSNGPDTTSNISDKHNDT